MPDPLTPHEVFLRLVHGVCEERWEDVIELRAHFGIGVPPGAYKGHALRRRPAGINVHETADPEVIVAEFRYEGTVVETGQPFIIPAVFVMRVRDGKIIESRDYLDHLRSARARGQLGDVLAAVREHHGTPE